MMVVLSATYSHRTIVPISTTCRKFSLLRWSVSWSSAMSLKKCSWMKPVDCCVTQGLRGLRGLRGGVRTPPVFCRLGRPAPCHPCALCARRPPSSAVVQRRAIERRREERRTGSPPVERGTVRIERPSETRSGVRRSKSGVEDARRPESGEVAGSSRLQSLRRRSLATFRGLAYLSGGHWATDRLLHRDRCSCGQSFTRQRLGQNACAPPDAMQERGCTLVLHFVAIRTVNIFSFQSCRTKNFGPRNPP